MELVTLQKAKTHLKLTGNYWDDDVRSKLAQAQAIVLEYIERPTDTAWTDEMATWTDETVPRQVEAAILIQLGDLFRNRGDGEDQQKREHGYLAPGVANLLHRLRDPALA